MHSKSSTSRHNFYLVLLLAGISLMLAACAAPANMPEPESNEDTAAEATSEPVETAVEEPTQAPTETPAPTEIPAYAPLGGHGYATIGVSRPEGGMDQFIVMQDGSERIQITNEDYQYWFMGGWSPDGSKIIGSCRDADSRRGIWTVNADGSDFQIIFEETDDVTYGAASYAYDGEHIVYTAGPHDGPYQIYIADLDGSNAQELGGDLGSLTRPSWSPMGIVYVASYTGKNDIYLMNPETGDYELLFDTEGNDSLPSLSPDGERVAWFQLGDNHIVFVGDIATGEYVEICEGSSVTWAPDGHLLFFNDETDQPSYMNSDGTGLALLTEIFGDLLEGAAQGLTLQP